MPGTLAFVIATARLIIPVLARAQLFSAPRLDPAFCQQPSYRQTVIYVDDMMMVEGHTEWAQRLADKPRATLAPGEKVTVVQLSASRGESHEIWPACWPAYSSAARAKLAQQSFIFQRSPLDGLSDQQKLFLRALNDALAQIYVAARRPAELVRIMPQSAPNKQILRALANDEGRFTSSTTTIRVIIYSNLAENGDLGSVFQTAAAPVDFGHKLGCYLRRSVFHGFGLGGDVTASPGFSEKAQGFWTAALRSMAATVGDLNSDLNVANILPLHGAAFTVTLDFDGQQLDGRLSLLTDDDGNLVDSWLGISRLSSTALTRSCVCAGNAEHGNCKLDAQTNSSLTTTSPIEELQMSGSNEAGLHGELGLKGSGTLFAITALAAR
jgi:hypothetical protein